MGYLVNSLQMQYLNVTECITVPRQNKMKSESNSYRNLWSSSLVYITVVYHSETVIVKNPIYMIKITIKTLTLPPLTQLLCFSIYVIHQV